jgi:hypothetical protein
MLQKLQQVALEGTIRITHAYLGHIKRDEDRKVLAYAEALEWEAVAPSARAVIEQHLYQAIEGPQGDVNFPCMYTGEVLSVARVASEAYDRSKNRPAVEILEAVRDLGEFNPDVLTELGNTMAYKVMSGGAVKNLLLAMIRFSIVPQLGAAPVPFVFATLIPLDDRQESLLDENQGQFVDQELRNVVKRSKVSAAVLFPCLDDDGREIADMLVYASSGAGGWFRALEATRRFSPRQEGQALVRMITEQSLGADVPHDLFRRMGEELVDQANEGLAADAVATSLEKAMGHGIDRLGFHARWESAFGDLSYRPAFDPVFGGPDAESPTRLKMQAGEIQIRLAPAHLEHFRQLTFDGRTFIAFEVPQAAKVVVGKDLDMRVEPVNLDELATWIAGWPARVLAAGDD